MSGANWIAVFGPVDDVKDAPEGLQQYQKLLAINMQVAFESVADNLKKYLVTSYLLISNATNRITCAGVASDVLCTLTVTLVQGKSILSIGLS
jgi:hypothetical protein